MAKRITRTQRSFGAAAVASLMVMLTHPAHAGSCSGALPSVACGVGLIAVYADPSDGVIQTDTPGPCSNSVFYNFQRTQQNFKELMAVMLTAFSTSKDVTVFVTQCVGDRNIIDHGAVTP